MKLEVYRKGRRLRSRIFAQDAVCIGRSPTCDVVLDGDGVAGIHALIERSPDGDGFLVDVSPLATTGVRLNDGPVSRAKLRQGDRLEIDEFELVVRCEWDFEVWSEQNVAVTPKWQRQSDTR